jgi:lincosamide nucleotidyltransferase A/C/D/E
MREMTANDVLVALRVLEDADIPVVVDGGWGVDALLGRQTRPHDDLDIAVPHHHVPRVRELFAAHGYNEIPRDDSWECNFVLSDGKGREVDIHSYTFDDNGKHVHGVEYRPEHLVGIGVIHGHVVRCIPAEPMVEFHTGYVVDETDYKDVKVLCEMFDLDVPEAYTNWQGNQNKVTKQ